RAWRTPWRARPGPASCANERRGGAADADRGRGTLRVRVRPADDRARDDRLPARLRGPRRLRRGARQRRLAVAPGGPAGPTRARGGTAGRAVGGAHARGPPPGPGGLPAGQAGPRAALLRGRPPGAEWPA